MSGIEAIRQYPQGDEDDTPAVKGENETSRDFGAFFFGTRYGARRLRKRIQSYYSQPMNKKESSS